MPPRFAYWTILIDNAPTAFRAKDQADLLPTLQQLRRTNPDVVLKWFAHGRLWDSPEQAREARQPQPRPQERRGRDWRPGGQHRDPRARTKPSRPGGPGRPGEPGRGAGEAGRPRSRGGPHAKKPWDKARPHGAYRDRPRHDGRPAEGRSRHRRPHHHAHGGVKRPFPHDDRAPLRDDRGPQKAWPKRGPDQPRARKPKPDGGGKPFTKPQWQARDQKKWPDQRGHSHWKAKRPPHGPPRPPAESDVPRPKAKDSAPESPKPRDDSED
jgi:hypothetical protein